MELEIMLYWILHWLLLFKNSAVELYTIILNVASDKCSFEELVSWITAHQV